MNAQDLLKETSPLTIHAALKEWHFRERNRRLKEARGLLDVILEAANMNQSPAEANADLEKVDRLIHAALELHTVVVAHDRASR